MSCLGLQGVELQLCRAAEAAEQAAAAANALRDRDSWIDLVEGLAGAIATLLLPLLAIFVVWRLSPLLAAIVERRTFSIKIAGFELSAQEATDQLRKQIDDLQSKLASLSAKTAPATAGEPSGGAPAPPVAPRREWRDDTAEAARRPRRILWVDDHPENNAFLIAGFAEAGIEVQTVLSTDDALRALESPGRYGLIISDLGRTEGILPRPKAGIALVSRVRESGLGLPIAIFAGQRGMRHAQEAREAGADLVTVSATELRRFVDSHLAGAHAD